MIPKLHLAAVMLIACNVFLISRIVAGDCANDTTIIHRLFNESSYSKHKLPNPDGVDVQIDLWVQEITAVSEISSDFEIDIYINEIWLDPALRFDDFTPCKQTIALTHQMFEKLWTPNSCFINSKSASIHDSPFRNIFLMIYSNGTLWANYRVKVKGPCEMDLSKFPMDEQKCTLAFLSFSYNNKEVMMHWKSLDPVLELKKFTLPDFEMVKITTWLKEAVSDPTQNGFYVYKLSTFFLVSFYDYPAGKWNELYVAFHFRRRFIWYILQAYIPTYLTIFISWISFTLGSKAIPARTMLGVNSLLAMIMMFGNIMRNLPRVSYVKAIDVWMLACMSFNFCSLVELAIVGYLTKDGTHDSRKMSSVENKKFSKHLHSQYPPHVARYIFDERKNYSCCRNCLNLCCPIWTADKIDTASCFIFPALFSLFNICYWTVYLSPW